MANLDTLQVQITAATKVAENNIDSLVQKLNGLKVALSAGTDTKAMVGYVNSFSNSLLSLGQSIDTVDVNRLKAVNSAIKTLSDNMGKFTDLGKLTMSNDLIPEENLEKIEKLQNKVYKLNESLEASKEVLEGYRQKLLHITLPKSFYSELGDDAKSARGYIGIRNSSVGTHSTAEEVTSALGWNNLNNEADVYAKLADELRFLSQSIKSDTLDIQSLEGQIEQLSQPTQTATNAVQNFATVGETASQSLSALAGSLSQMQGIYVTEEQLSGAGAITRIANSLSAVSGEQLTTSFNAISDGLTRISKVPPSNAENLMTTASAINRFGYESSTKAGANIASVANSLPKLTEAVTGTEGVNAENITNLGVAVGKFGSAGAQRAAENLPQLAVGFRQLMTTLANAPAVSENTIRLAEAMSQMSQRAAGISNAVNRAGNSLNIFGTHTHRTGIRVKSLAAIFGGLYANFFLLIRGARLAGKAIEYSSQMTEAMNVVDVAFGKSNGVLKDFIQTSIKDFGLGRLAAAQYASRFQAMAKTMGINAADVGKANEFIAKKTQGNALAYDDLGTSVADMSINLTKLTADMASLYNQDFESVAQDMQSVMTGMTKPLRKFGLDIGVASLKAFALKNGLDADIESMTQAEKTLLRYQYVMANASGAMGDFQKTADTWANTMRTVKQLLQEFGRILGEAFINAFRPALIAFRNFMYNMLDLTQSALNAVGKLLGWTKIDFGGASLVEDMEDYSDALDDAAGNAKKLKGQLRGIDELNNLTTSNPGGGGGGADSGLGLNGNDLWENIEETKEKYESDVKSWYDLGRRIANHIKDGLSSINWSEVYAEAMGLGSNAANFLNGLISPDGFYVFGKTLAGGIMTAIKTAFAFGKDFDWENLGNAIAEGINGFFDEFDGGELADTLDVWVKGLWKTMKTAVSKVDWKDVFMDMLDFLTSIDLDTMTITATAITFVVSSRVVSTAIASMISGALAESPLSIPAIIAAAGGGLLIGNGLGQILFQNTEDYGDYLEANPFTNDSKLGQWTTDLMEDTYDFWKDPWKAITGWSFNDFWQVLIDDLAEIEEAFIIGLGKKLLNVDDITDFNPIELFDIAFENAYDKGEEIGKKIAKKIVAGIKTLTKDAKEFWSDPWKAITGETWSDYWTHKGFTANDLLAMFPEIEGNLVFYNIGKMIVEGIISGATDESGNLSFKALFDNFIAGIKKIFGIASPAKKMYSIGEDIALGVLEGIKQVPFLQKLNEWFNDNVAPWFSAEKWQGLGKTVKDKISTTLSYSNMWNIGNQLGKGLYDAAKSMFDSLLNAYKTLKANIENNPIIQVVKTVTDGSYSGGSASDWVEYKDPGNGGKPAGVKDPPKTTTTPTWHNIPSIPSSVPASQREAYIENWKKNHQENFYAKGGFPEIGSLFFAGEAGAELVGGINGKTGVASNMEITGIREAILQTSSEEVVLLRQQNQLLTGILQKEFGISSDALFRSVRDSASDFTTRTGRPAFS